MLRALPVLIAIILVVYCLIDLAQTPSEDVRSVSRPVWVVVILLVPFVGPICWLVAGRPNAREVHGPGPFGRAPARPVAPDDDPEFLARLKQHRLNAEDERLRKWQADLERRERDLRGEGDSGGPAGGASAT